jgi:pimeloyl-ACP methyl ester carboxylesterase
VRRAKNAGTDPVHAQNRKDAAELGPMVHIQGNGPALVLLPGIQGRWEYARPTVDALAAYFRVVTFSLGGRSRNGRDIFHSAVDRLASVLDVDHIDRAILCGISYGGLVATRFAAMHPERTAALVMASTPGPEWHLRPRHHVYARWPRLFGPLFLTESPFRLRAELLTALPDRADRRRFVRWQVRTILSAPVSLPQMAERARELPIPGIVADCRSVTAPTLIVTGEPALDRVVPVEGTASYLDLIRGAKHVVLERTGHQGTITRSSAFAALVNEFVNVKPISRSEVA